MPFFLLAAAAASMATSSASGPDLGPTDLALATYGRDYAGQDYNVRAAADVKERSPTRPCCC